MKTHISGCILLVLTFACNASAQLIAGSPEDILFGQITSASTPAEKISLATQFETEFVDAPPPVLASLFTVMMAAFEQQQDYRQAFAYGEKVIAQDPENVNAYMALCRYLSVNLREDLAQAVVYGERGVELAEAMQNQEPPLNYTAEQWETYTIQTETYANSILTYAKIVQPDS